VNVEQKSSIHEDPDFGELLREVSAESGGAISPEFVEKDYWVTMTLATLAATGLEIWFKGGTALAKGFGAINRFSEDLDLKILGSAATVLPVVSSWKSEKRGAVESRISFFNALNDSLRTHGLESVLSDNQDEFMRSANIECVYPGALRQRLAAPFKPFILLEVGVARVTPFLSRSISSFVHDHLARRELLGNYIDCRPITRCVHPLVTLIEKLDAIGRYFGRSGEDFRPEKFIRHYDDVAALAVYLESDEGRALPIPEGLGSHAAVPMTAQNLAAEMLRSSDIRKIPSAADDAFLVTNEEKRIQLERAHLAIAPMYWAPRTDFTQACGIIRNWINTQLS
jgi:hypothetical protein